MKSILLTTTEGITIEWEELLEFHARRARLYRRGSRLQIFHKTQGQIILLKLTEPSNNAWTWEAAIQNQMNKKQKAKPDSFCVECGEPAFAPKGNFNINRVTLCESKKCIRQRRSALQKERRKQKALPGLLPPMKQLPKNNFGVEQY